ncbi:MAG: hypothetical protein HY226_04525 [Candidatus Vogelbacteria bacterium]|nr:hypothetical protein [Candidatus Vogelbacteria bacterium]
MSNDKFVLSGAQSHELETAFGLTGWSKELVKKLSGRSNAALVRAILEGRTNKVEIVRHFVDFSAIPDLPYEGSRYFKYLPGDQPAQRKSGRWEIDEAAGKALWSGTLLTGDQGGPYTRLTSIKLWQKLLNSGKTLVGAQLMDYLLEHPEAMPFEWTYEAALRFCRTITVHFPGTVYRGPGGKYIRCFTAGPNGFVVGQNRIDDDRSGYYFGGNFSAVTTL